MCAKRVLILSDQPLFAQGVRALIQANAAANVIGVEPCDENVATVVHALQPDLIILEDAQDPPPALFMSLLDVLPHLRLIRLSLDRNVMRVYEKQQLVANGAQDLVRVLENFQKEERFDES